jgi:hypothetical protein
MLNVTLVRTRLEYASVPWNTLTDTDVISLERTQRSV